MANHKKHDYLDPAYSVIQKFCKPGEGLSAGIAAVAAITGTHRTNVYRWMLSADARGTGGHVPAPQQRKLVEYAREKRMPLRPEDFFNVAHAA
jgi:hypothetical protein